MKWVREGSFHVLARQTQNLFINCQIKLIFFIFVDGLILFPFFHCQVLVEIRAEKEELQALLQQKHFECQNYYEKLQEIHSNFESKELKLNNAEETLHRKEQEIAM